MAEGGETEKKKYFCLHCGTIFESDKDAPYCPNCRRKRVIPLELLGASLKKHRDELKELGVLPESDTNPVTPEVATTSGDVAGSNGSGANGTSVSTTGGTGVNVAEPVSDSGTSTVTADVPVTSESAVTGDVDRKDVDRPESDELLARYLRDLEDEPEVTSKSAKSESESKPKPSRRKVRRVTVPVGRSLIEVLLFIGLVVLLYKWWTSRQSTPSPSSEVGQVDRPGYGSTLETINRNLGYRTLR